MRVCFLGHGKLVCDIADELLKANHSVAGIVTHPQEIHEQESEFYLAQKKHGLYESVFDYACNNKIDILEIADINDSFSMQWIQERKPDIIVSISCRSIVKKDFLDVFKQKVINIHCAKLPKYRGAAGATWFILNNEKEAAVTFHYIDTGIDTGDIINQFTFPITNNALPKDILKISWDIAQNNAINVFEGVIKGDIVPKKMDLAQGSYFPRLNTERDARINLNWPNDDIERFIRAFSFPYSGAFCFLGQEKIRIAEVSFSDEKYHPSSIGLIINTTKDKGVSVVTSNGVMHIKKIRQGLVDLIDASQKLKLGKKVN